MQVKLNTADISIFCPHKWVMKQLGIVGPIVIPVEAAAANSCNPQYINNFEYNIFDSKYRQAPSLM